MTHSSERDTQPVPKVRAGSTQQLPKVKKPKYQPRHKKENNTGIKFLGVLVGLVTTLGAIAYVDWDKLGDDQAKPKPSPSAPSPQPTVTVTETVSGNSQRHTVTAEPSPGPTTTVTISPSVTPTVTATATATVTATETVTVPGPVKTVPTTVPPTTIIKCIEDGKEIPCPTGD